MRVALISTWHRCGGALTLLHNVEVALMLDPAPATDPTARTTIVTRSITLL